VARVAILRRAKAGVLPKRPQTATIHGGIDAACEGEFARVAQIVSVLDVLDVFRGIEWRHLHAPGRLHGRRWPRRHTALPATVWRLLGLRIGVMFHSCAFHADTSSGSAGQLGYRRTTGGQGALLIFRYQPEGHIVLAITDVFVSDGAVNK